MTYITASELSFCLPDTTKLFSNINFSFNRGRTAIVGKNGVGKTTLFHLIQQKIIPTTGTITNSGYCEELPQDFSKLENLDLLDILEVKDIYFAYKSIISGLYDEKQYDILDNRWDIESDIEESLGRFGFNNIDLNRKFSSFSGGEKVRLLFSKILIKNPDFFLMDEPTNNLDSETKQYIYNFISEWKKGIIVISHDRTLLDLMENIYELTHIGIKHYSGNFSFYEQQKELERDRLKKDIVTANKEFKKAIKQREESLKKHARRAKNGKKKIGSLPKCVTDGRKGASEISLGKLKRDTDKKIEYANEKYTNLLNKKQTSLKIRVDLLGEVNHKTKVLVNAENINFKYDKKNIWHNNLSFLIQGQEIVRLTGRNGSGKSTLCKIISGELSPTIGEIKVNITRVSILDQSISFINNNLTLLENIEMFAKPDMPEHRLRIILGGFLFYGDDVFKRAGVLSGGEKMRLAMACIFSTNSSSELLILDEPTNNMDLESIDVLSQSIKNYSGALIIISHDERFIEEIEIDRTIAL